MTIEETMTKKPVGRLSPKEKRIIRPKSTARKIFDSTPAEATATVPHF